MMIQVQKYFKNAQAERLKIVCIDSFVIPMYNKIHIALIKKKKKKREESLLPKNRENE